MTIDRSQVSIRVCPLIPDAHAALVQILNVRVATQEPEQLVKNGFEVQFLGREQRKSLRELVPSLPAEYA